VAAHGKEAWAVSPLELSGGWYDVTVTADSDAAWSQRFVGHLETGQPRITGSEPIPWCGRTAAEDARC
jgi:phospholipase C